ncbi:MAG: HDOD domain-containing protein [bacterium]|nr:HDOD domain-containing protein [bacterium]MCP5065059.1 HDOD domain-containing protein [bacterium]
MGSVSERELQKRIREMAPLSESAKQLLGLMEDPDHAISDVIAVVEKDGPLIARVLRICNSSALAPPSPIEQLDHAVSYLGERTVVSAAMLQGCDSWLQTDLKGYLTGPGGLWASGLQGAIAARVIAQNGALAVSPSLAYTGALLRDLGKAVLSPFLENRVAGLMARVANGTASDWLAAEREMLGVDHAAVGVRVAGQFQLSPALTAVIEHHHGPAGAAPEVAQLVQIVHVADGISAMTGGAPSADAGFRRISGDDLSKVGLDTDGFAEAIAAAVDEFQQVSDSLY